MAGRVGNDELALVGIEEAVGNIDGDALLSLGGQPVHQQRKVNVVALCADAFGVAFQRLHLIVEQGLCFIQHTADQGALTIVDGAAGDKAQRVQCRLLFNVLFQFRGHDQKYPSIFFFSIDALASLSISRPSRSLERATISSRMTASSVSALDSTAAVSG